MRGAFIREGTFIRINTVFIMPFIQCHLDSNPIVSWYLDVAPHGWFSWIHLPYLENLDMNWASSWENLFLPYANNKGADQPSLISIFVIRCLDSIIPVVSISEISSLYLASVAEQAGLCLTWLQTPKTGFLVTRLNLWLVVATQVSSLRMLLFMYHYFPCTIHQTLIAKWQFSWYSAL